MTLEESVKWLIQPKNERHLRVLQVLGKKTLTAPDLQQAVGIDHPQKVYRSLGYLEDRGLVDRFYDSDLGDRAYAFEASPLGREALDLVGRIDEVLVSHRK